MHLDPHSTRRVLLVVGAQCPGPQDAGVRQVAAAAAGAHVLLAAPAGPAPGERWIVDLDARDAHAHRRLESWAAALEPHAAHIDAEAGDASPALALADARAAFAADEVLLVVGERPPRAPRLPRRGLRVRLPDIRVIAEPGFAAAAP